MPPGPAASTRTRGTPSRQRSPSAPRAIADLTEEERLLQPTAREFAEREVAPSAIERHEAERFDRSIFERMGALGLTAAPIPEAVGVGPGSRISAGRS